MKIKTLKDMDKANNIDLTKFKLGDNKDFVVSGNELKEETIKIFKNLQGPDTIYPIILNNFPDSSKGSIAKGQWNDTTFRYGTEYGMLAMLFWLMNLTEEELK